MDVTTPGAALEAKAPTPTSPNAGWDAIVRRSDNPIRRTVDVMCVILIQLLVLMVLVDEKDPEKRRGCYVLAPDSILSRLDRGEDFGLPLPLVASIRLVIRLLRAQYHLGQDYIDWLTAPQAATPRPHPPCRSILFPSPRGRGRGRGAVPPGLPPVQRSPASPNPAPITLGHHPPARPPPPQKSSHPIPLNRARFVTNTKLCLRHVAGRSRAAWLIATQVSCSAAHPTATLPP